MSKAKEIEALKKIEQFSDSGDYATSIVKIKAIASEALASYKGGEDNSSGKETGDQIVYGKVESKDVPMQFNEGDYLKFLGQWYKKKSVPPYKEEVDILKRPLFLKENETYCDKCNGTGVIQSKEEVGEDHEK
jgi:hypothetical protein